MMTNNSLYGNFRNPKFTDIWNDAGDFITDVYSSPLSALEQNELTILYYLLYGRYGNSVIANSDREQFKFKVYGIIFMYGPTWVKRLDIQKKLRELNDEEIAAGSRVIYNHAYNPATAPTTSTLEELTHINDQNTTNYKKSKLESYATLTALLEKDVSKEFLDKFRPLFLQVVEPEQPLWYSMEEQI